MMKLFSFVLVFFCFTDLMLSAQENKTATYNATQFLQKLKDKNFTEAHSYLNEKKTHISRDKLANLWIGVISKMGEIDSTRYLETEKYGKGNLVHIATYFRGEGEFDFQVTLDEENKVIGFFLKPPKPKAKWKAPAYITQEVFTSREVFIKSGKYKLPAILTLPVTKEKVPLVILIHGSGPNDRDETIGPNKPFKEIAEGLSSRGIAVLRYDKRTAVYHNLDSTITIKEEVTDDVFSAIEKAEDFKEIDNKKIYVLGHSLGGMLAPMIAEKEDELAGIILLAGAARPLEDLLLEQYQYLTGMMGENAEAKADMDKMEKAVKRVKSDELKNIAAKDLPLGINKAYWMSLKNYTPAKTISKLKCRILILQGQRDYNVTIDDYDLWKKALEGNKHADFILYEKLNHIFHEGIGKSVPTELDEAGNIPAYVIEDIADWVKK